MNYDNIPQYIKDNASFCCWKYETVNDRITKVPYNPVSGYRANVAKPNTFTDFKTAITQTGYDGIGIRIAGDVIGIDLDHCVVDETFEPWAKEITEHFTAAYIEYSPSGTGLRILSKLPSGFQYDKKCYYIKKGNVEVYVAGATNRFVTLTGNMYQAGDVVEDAAALNWLLDTHMKRKQPTGNISTIQRDSYLSDESVLEKSSTAKNADKFNKLWNGDISGYPSHSEADVALCSILAFYCNGNFEQIDRLFQKSALMRDKWTSSRGDETYGAITIKQAVTNTTVFYSPLPKVTAYEDFAEGLELLEQLNPIDNSKYSWTEIGAGRIFADFNEATLRYVPDRKMWFYYENGYWQSDTGNLKAHKACMQLADLLHLFALRITDEHKRKTFITYSNKWQFHSYRNNILKDAQVHKPISMKSFDCNPYIFNCKNGTLHLDTGNFTPHSSEDKLTKISDVEYDPVATCDRWNDFITEIMSGDMEKAKFLKKIFGYALSGDNRHECMMILHGATSRNGKGTLCESILKVFGSYGCTARPESIAAKNNTNSSAPSEDIARLAGVRFVNISEPEKRMALNVAQVKSMTGNDTLNARFLHENSFDFKPQFKLYINTNYLPSISDMTIFSSGRIITIPFEQHFSEGMQDKTLKAEFAKPSSQSAILNWLIAGFNLLRKEGLAIPAAIQNATDKYKHDSDKLALFIEDCLEQGESFEERSAVVYANYKHWCMENGHYPESMKNFKQSLSASMTIVRKRPASGGEKTTMVIGYRVVSEFLT